MILLLAVLSRWDLCRQSLLNESPVHESSVAIPPLMSLQLAILSWRVLIKQNRIMVSAVVQGMIPLNCLHKSAKECHIIYCLAISPFSRQEWKFVPSCARRKISIVNSVTPSSQRAAMYDTFGKKTRTILLSNYPLPIGFSSRISFINSPDLLGQKTRTIFWNMKPENKKIF